MKQFAQMRRKDVGRERRKRRLYVRALLSFALVFPFPLSPLCKRVLGDRCSISNEKTPSGKFAFGGGRTKFYSISHQYNPLHLFVIFYLSIHRTICIVITICRCFTFV